MQKEPCGPSVAARVQPTWCSTPDQTVASPAAVAAATATNAARAAEATTLRIGDTRYFPRTRDDGAAPSGSLPQRRVMFALDHVGFAVADYKRSKAFYEQALAPLGMTLLMEFSGAAAGFGKDDAGRPSFFIEAHGEPVRGRLHIALRAENRAQVDAFHAAAVDAGGSDNGAPGVRPAYHPASYRASVLDPGGT